MAAGLGYIEFATGDILTAAAANGYLASQTVMVFASAADRTSAIASPQEGMVSYLKDTNAIQYYDGSAWMAVGAGGGKVLQVVMGSTSTSVTNSTTTYADTGLTASITPSATTSKILVLTAQHAYWQRSAANAGFGLQLLRSGTAIANMASSGFDAAGYGQSGANAEFIHYSSFHYLDAPSSTSSLTYKLQGRPNVSGGIVIFQNGSPLSTIILMEIGA